MTSPTSSPPRHTAQDCAECGAELRDGAKFCPACGASTAAKSEVATAARAPEPEPAAAAAEPAPKPTAVEEPASAKPAAQSRAPVSPAPPPVPRPAPAASEGMLLPRIPTTLFWTPRKPWVVTTGLSDDRIAEIFTTVMTSKPSIWRRANNYWRRVQWNVSRRSRGTEVVATCVPNGLVEVGVGRTKQLVDVSGDEIACDIARPSSAAKAEVSVAITRHTTFWWMHAYPPTIYTFDAVKALKRADRTATVKYPWSPFRMVLVSAIAIALIAAAASGGGGNASVGAGSDPGTPIASTGGGDDGGGGGSSSNSTLPDRPTTSDPVALANELNRAQQIIDDPSSSAPAVRSAAHVEQLGTRAIQLDPSLRSEVYSSLDPAASRTIRATVASQEDLLPKPQPDLPRWHIVAPRPARELRSYYREAEAQSGIPWQYFAAINLVETRMGRIRGDSSAGARGPMQFLPETWASYGQGDINSPRDSILAAARLLVSNGAPADMPSALRSYNHDSGWVRAIRRYARLMRADPRSYRALHAWDVIYNQVGGAVILPVGYPRVRPVPAD